MMIKLSGALAKMRQAFKEAKIEDATFEAKALLTGLLDFSTLDLISKEDTLLDEDQVQKIDKAIEERLSGKPVYRILGWREFYGLRFALSAETLEPRPDTEILVDELIPIANQFIDKHGSCEVLDLGTGTGAIALSILHNCPEATAVGLDLSLMALETASRNAEELGLNSRFSTCHSNWFENVDGKFDVIVSNPPYISADRMAELSVEVDQHDPHLALYGGEDGLDAYRLLASQSANFMREDSVLALEIGFDQNISVKKIFENNGFKLVSEHKDLAGQDRVLIFRQI